jgi:hypothetical protein
LTDGLSPDQVVDRLEALARRSLNLPTTTSTSRSLPQSA